MPNSPLHSRVVGNWEVAFRFASYPLGTVTARSHTGNPAID